MQKDRRRVKSAENGVIYFVPQEPCKDTSFSETQAFDTDQGDPRDEFCEDSRSRGSLFYAWH